MLRLLLAAVFMSFTITPLAVSADAREDQLLLDVQPLIAQYAPHVDRVTLTSIIAVESSGWPWTIRDDTDRDEPPMYLPNYDAAVRVASRLVDIGHNLDLGVAQINTSNLSWVNMDVASVLKPQNNLRAAQIILEAARRTIVEEEGRAWVDDHSAAAATMISALEQKTGDTTSARNDVIEKEGEAWVRSHGVEAARREVQLYHANAASPGYLAAIMKIAPHVWALLARATS